MKETWQFFHERKRGHREVDLFSGEGANECHKGIIREFITKGEA